MKVVALPTRLKRLSSVVRGPDAGKRTLNRPGGVDLRKPRHSWEGPAQAGAFAARSRTGRRLLRRSLGPVAFEMRR